MKNKTKKEKRNALNTEQTLIYLREDIKVNLKAHAKKEGLTLTALFNRLAYNFLKEHEKCDPKREQV